MNKQIGDAWPTNKLKHPSLSYVVLNIHTHTTGPSFFFLSETGLVPVL